MSDFPVDLPSRQARPSLPLLIAISLALLVLVLGAVSYFAGWWGAGSLPVLGSDSAGGSIDYVTESARDGSASASGIADSPLRVRFKMPVVDGSPLFPATALLQLLDDKGNPAEFGGQVQDSLPLQPSTETGVWQYDGSVPSKPGTYHARVQLQLSVAEPGTPTPQPQVYDYPEAKLVSSPESGPRLSSGFVFSRDSNLWLLSTDTSKQRRLTFYPGYYELANQPAWSPDGKWIAFSYSPRVPQNEIPATNIWTIKPDGTSARQLAEHGTDESLYDPAWSSDGKYIYFTVEKSAMSSSIYDAAGAPVGQRSIDRLDLATGQRTGWLQNAQMPASVGASGDVICLQDVISEDSSQTGPGGSSGGWVGQRMLRVGPDGKTRSVLVSEKAFQMMYAPSVSPDGKWVAFSAIKAPGPQGNRPGIDLFGWLLFAPSTAYAHGQPWDLYLLPLAGGTPSQPVQLTNLNEDQPYPTWLDNSTMAFMGTRGLYKLTIDAHGKPAGAPATIHEGAPHGGLTWHSP